MTTPRPPRLMVSLLADVNALRNAADLPTWVRHQSIAACRRVALVQAIGEYDCPDRHPVLAVMLRDMMGRPQDSRRMTSSEIWEWVRNVDPSEACGSLLAIERIGLERETAP